MIAALAVLTALALDSPTATFAACKRAHNRLTSARVSLSVIANIDQARRADYTITYARPGRAVLRVRCPEQAGVAAIDRTFAVSGDSFSAFDAVAYERLARRVKGGGGFVDRLGVFTDLDQPVRMILDPAEMAAFLDTFPSDSWKLSKLAGNRQRLRRFVRSAHRVSDSVLEFRGQDYLLARVSLASDSGRLEWKFDYETPPANVAFAPPVDAVVVTAFTDKPAWPKSMEPAARSLAERSSQAYSRLRFGSWTIEPDGVTVWFSGTMMKEKSPRATWTFDGRRLAVDKYVDGTFHSGNCTISQVVPTLRSLGIEPSLSVVQYQRRSNPVVVFLSQADSVRLAGRIVVGGVGCAILEASAPAMRLTLLVREKDGLLAQTRVENLDRAGEVVNRSERGYRYSTSGTPLPKEVFQLKAKPGVTVRKLVPRDR